MNQTHHLRVLFEDVLEEQLREPGIPPTPAMQPFLIVPVQERLILLSLYDQQSGADPRTLFAWEHKPKPSTSPARPIATEALTAIKAALPFAKETNIRLTSKRMLGALADLTAAMENPTGWIHPGPYPDCETGDLGDSETPFPINTRDIPDDTEKQLRQAFFPATPLMLFGTHVPAAIAELGLQRRAILYLLIVEDWEWSGIQALLQCSKGQVEYAQRRAIEVLESAEGGG
jgi:hypothetical protein